jgi:hypothetical protein
MCAVYNCTNTGPARKVIVASNGGIPQTEVELCAVHFADLHQGRLIYSMGCSYDHIIPKDSSQSHYKRSTVINQDVLNTPNSKFDFILQ